MRKRFLSVIVVLLLVLSSLFSSGIPSSDRLSFYLRGTVSPSLVSEGVYSLPAKKGNLHFALGLDISFDIYRNDTDAKWGLSTSLHASYPLVSGKYDNFVSSGLEDRNAFLMAGAGAVFRCTPSTYLDASLALRMEVMTYDYFTRGIILGVTAETRADYFMTDDFFFSGGLSLTNGFLKFTPASEDTWYDNLYSTLLFRAQIGAGYRFGGERKR